MGGLDGLWVVSSFTANVTVNLFSRIHIVRLVHRDIHQVTFSLGEYAMMSGL